MTWMSAGDKRIEPFNLVGQPVQHKKIERPISNGRLRSEPILTEPVEDGIGAKGTVLLQQNLQHLTTHRRKAKPVSGAACLGRGKRIAHTCRMIMVRKPKRTIASITIFGVTCHVITFCLSNA